jgi:hypothetical protein
MLSLGAFAVRRALRNSHCLFRYWERYIYHPACPRIDGKRRFHVRSRNLSPQLVRAISIYLLIPRFLRPKVVAVSFRNQKTTQGIAVDQQSGTRKRRSVRKVFERNFCWTESPLRKRPDCYLDLCRCKTSDHRLRATLYRSASWRSISTISSASGRPA